MEPFPISKINNVKDESLFLQITFSRYAERTAFERPLTSGVAYAVKVLHSEREQFEKQQGWRIKRMDSTEQSPAWEEDADLVNEETSRVQGEYAPVIFAQDTYKHVISFDMLTGKVRHYICFFRLSYFLCYLQTIVTNISLSYFLYYLRTMVANIS